MVHFDLYTALVEPGLSQNDSDCPRLAKHALVLGPGGPIRSDPLHPSSNKGPSDSAFQRASSPEPSESESSIRAATSSEKPCFLMVELLGAKHEDSDSEGSGELAR